MDNNLDEVRKQAFLSTLFGETNQEELLQAHINGVKAKILSELEKLAGEHYFWKWCKDHWELFETYEVMTGCLLTGAGKSEIYGSNLFSEELVLTITEDRCAGIFLKSDRVFQLRLSIDKK